MFFWNQRFIAPKKLLTTLPTNGKIYLLTLSLLSALITTMANKRYVSFLDGLLGEM
jgi:hypothetical protein